MLHHSWTPGVPIPQGSKSVSRTGHAYEANKKLRPWRKTLETSMRAQHDGPPIDEPVQVETTFVLPAPKKPKFDQPAVKPDIDKLTRAVLDALQTAGVLKDDSRVVELVALKRYPRFMGRTGVTVVVRKPEHLTRY